MKSILLKVLMFVPIRLAQFFFSEKIALNADKKRIVLVYFGYLYYLCR